MDLPLFTAIIEFVTATIELFKKKPKLTVVFTLVIVSAGIIAWNYFAKPHCSPRDKRMVRIILPWQSTPDQKQKGDDIADKINKELDVNHYPPESLVEPDKDAPKGNNHIRYFFPADADLAERLKKWLPQFLKRPAETFPVEQFQHKACPGDVELWISSAE